MRYLWTQIVVLVSNRLLLKFPFPQYYSMMVGALNLIMNNHNQESSGLTWEGISWTIV